MDLNVFKDYPYSKHYYITHPWKIITHTWDNLRAAWQRATKGYANRDVWDADHYILSLLPSVLRALKDAEFGSYPGQEPFETPEKWAAWLQEMAAKFESLQEDWAETRNEYDKLYFDALQGQRNSTIDIDITALRKKWLARLEELNQEQSNFTIKTFEELGRYLYYLWN